MRSKSGSTELIELKKSVAASFSNTKLLYHSFGKVLKECHDKASDEVTLSIRYDWYDRTMIIACMNDCECHPTLGTLQLLSFPIVFLSFPRPQSVPQPRLLWPVPMSQWCFPWSNDPRCWTVTQSPGANFAAAVLRAPFLGAAIAGVSADIFERSLGIAADSCHCPPTALRENHNWRRAW